jgi:flagellin FlaB
MLRKRLKKAGRDQRGITGLETAIVLIAFVVVAAVFAYTALSAGLFSTQESSDAVYEGLETAQSTLEIKGGVIGLANATGATTTGKLEQILVTLSVCSGGEAINFTDPTVSGSNDGKALSTSSATHYVTISYVDKDQRVDDLYWTHTALADADTDDLLEDGEQFLLTIGGSDGNNLVDALATDLSCGREFKLEIKPPVGAVMQIERTTPGYINAVINMN